VTAGYSFTSWKFVSFSSTSNWRQQSVCGLPVECLKLEITGSVWITSRVPQTGDNCLFVDYR